MILHAYVDVYVLCVCIVGHGYGYTTTAKIDMPLKKETKVNQTWKSSKDKTFSL